MGAVTRAVPLAGTTAPGLRLARELLADEEAFAPLGLDEVLVLDSRSFREESRPEGTGLWDAVEGAWGDRPGIEALVAKYAFGYSSLFLSVEGYRAIVLDMAPMPPERDFEHGTRLAARSAATQAQAIENHGQEAMLARALACTRTVEHSFFLSSSEGILLRDVLAHEIGHARTEQAIGRAGFVKASSFWDPYGTPLGTEMLRRGLVPPTLYAATSPGEWLAESYALCVAGRCDEGNAALVEEVRERVREGRTWEP